MPASDAVTASDQRPPDSAAAAADAQARLQRTLKLVVVALAVLLLAGLLTVIGRVIYLASSPRTQPGAPASAALSPAIRPELSLALPQGAVVRSVALEGNRLAVHYDAGGGAGIAVLDLETGRVITSVAIEPGAAPR
jgi:hypothetical protein